MSATEITNAELSEIDRIACNETWLAAKRQDTQGTGTAWKYNCESPTSYLMDAENTCETLSSTNEHETRHGMPRGAKRTTHVSRRSYITRKRTSAKLSFSKATNSGT